MPLSAGDKLGPYEILASVGAGGMGEVYRAHDPRLGRDVAIKISAQRFTDRFEREARAIAALNHPNVCQVYDIGPNYLVLEFIEGTPLRGPCPLDQVQRYATQICDALDAAHKRNITHRDLKPANILVTASGIKLLDFGLALLGRDDRQPAAMEAEATIGMTQPGTILGTAAYMSPEQAEAKPVDARSDIFSFGSVLYEMLSGCCAFTGDSTLAIMAAIVRDESKPLDAPPAWQSIVTRCLCKSPADRFQSMAQVKDALLAASVAASSGVSAAVSGARTALPTASSSMERTPSIAVLPFANMSPDADDEYFSDGLAGDIISFLAQVPGLKVTARTSAFAFKGKTEDIRKIAGTLGVATILEGSVRRSGNRIRVTAELINALDGYHLWSQRYDREMKDLFDLQDEIAQAIASALHVELSGTPAPFQQYKPSLPAYEALLKARYYQGIFRPDLLPRIKECYERAIALDPKFALAHCEYGGYFWGMTLVGAMPATQSLPMMRAQARKALELDSSLPDACALLGVVAAFLEYDWKEAERCFSLAMARNPVSVNVRLYYAMGYLAPTGRLEEGRRQIELGLQEDRLNLNLRVNWASSLAAAGRDEEAAEEFREVLELNPSMAGARSSLATLHASLGELDQALALCEQAYILAPTPSVTGLLAGLLKRTGDTRRAEDLLQKLPSGDAFGAPRGQAVYHWVLQEFDEEADWIEKAIDQHDPYGALYLRGCYSRELRSTPHWARLMRKLNLPEA
jgi:eukaryotic-like serine/threonine-protein kinase